MGLLTILRKHKRKSKEIRILMVSLLNIWDVGGQKSLRAYWRNYFEKTDALVWVLDSADRWRMDDCKEELHNLLKEDKLIGATLLIFANKQDQLKALSADEIQSALELDIMTTRQWNLVSCSALKNENIEEGFNWLVKDVQNRLYAYD